MGKGRGKGKDRSGDEKRALRGSLNLNPNLVPGPSPWSSTSTSTSTKSPATWRTLASVCAAAFLVVGIAQTAHANPADERHRSYRIQPGDSLRGIALEQLGAADRVDEILQLNPTIEDPNKIHAGQEIWLPASAATDAQPTVPEESQDGSAIGDMQQNLRDHAAALGLLGAGIGLVLACMAVAIGIEVLISLLIGAFFLWLGAHLAGIEERRFGSVFKANLFGTITWGVALLVGLAVAITLPLPPMAKVVVAVVAVLGVPYLAYLTTVRRRLDTSFPRAFVACLIAGLLPMFFSGTLYLAGLALGLLPVLFI